MQLFSNFPKHGVVVAVFTSLLMPLAYAQNEASAVSSSAGGAGVLTQSFEIGDGSKPDEAKEVSIALRNTLSSGSQVTLDGQRTLVVTAPADQVQLAQKIVDDIQAAGKSNGLKTGSRMATTQKITVRNTDEQAVQQTFYLPTKTEVSEEENVLNTIRMNGSPTSKIYVLEGMHEIVMKTTPDQLKFAQTTIKQLIPTWSVTDASEPYEGESSGTYTDNVVEQSFYLSTKMDHACSNEVLVALRNLLDPMAKVYLVPSQNVIVVTATANDLQLAWRMLSDMLAPRSERSM